MTIKLPSANLKGLQSSFQYAAPKVQIKSENYIINMSSRELLLAFLRIESGNQFVFFTQAGKGAAVVDNLRTRLSRLRAKAKRRNIKLVYFKLYTCSIQKFKVFDTNEGHVWRDKVIIKKEANAVTDFTMDLEEFDLMSKIGRKKK